MRAVLSVLAAVSCVCVAQKVTPIARGVEIETVRSGTVRLTIETSKAFRVSIGKAGPITEDPYLALPSTVPSWTQGTYSGNSRLTGITVAGVGGIFIDPNSTQFVMTDAAGDAVTTASQLLQPSGGGGGSSTCDSARPGYDASATTRIPEDGGALSGQTQASCCAACDSHPDCNAWVYATSNPSQGDNCWLLSSASGLFSSPDRVFGGQTNPPTPMPSGGSISLDAAVGASFYGSGAGQGDAGTLPRTSGNKLVVNRQSNAPFYWSSEGYAALGVVDAQWTQASATSVRWSTVTDLYIWPAATVDASSQGLFSVIGSPAMPPRWSLGFLACRWGWNSEAYINATLPQFAQGDYPITAYISDFSWFTAQNDYNCPAGGWDTYNDFGYNNLTYPNPTEQLTFYRDKLHLRMMGIRKPRLCNSQLLAYAKSQGWLVAGDLNGRNLNFTIPAVRAWYAKQQAHYLQDGVQAFWNDEAEVYYYQFYYWNMAQVATLEAYDPTKRFYSINRAFTPGMQRMGVTIWTGDIDPSWEQLQITPGYMLNWGLMGAPYVTCDIGGFTGQTNALLLARWYQTGVFLPIMRVHSTESATPHFPFLWPTDAADSMRDSLDLRFQLLPALNSLAYRASTEGTLIMRPLMADFFADEQARNITSQWMMGSGIMAAPVLNQDNSSTTYFPAGSGLWYDFNATSTHNGGDTVQITDAGLDFIPVYARAGAVLPLGPVVQSFDFLPGGPLTVHVYAGTDGSFTLVEDDGVSKGSADSQIRSTAFVWNDATKTLSWTVSGSFSGSTVYTQVSGILFDSKNSGPVASALMSLGKPGSINFS